MTKVFFRYKPIDYFIDSKNYDVSWISDTGNKSWNNLEDFDYSEIGEATFFEDYGSIHTEFKLDLIATNTELQIAFELNGQFGCDILEHNGETYFYEIHDDLILEKYPKEEYPEYYL